MTEFVDETTKDRRLATLRVLRENEGAANESVLGKALHLLGFRGRNATVEALAEDALRLEKAGLAKIVLYLGEIRTLEITDAGRAYLERRIDPVPGIGYPRS